MQNVEMLKQRVLDLESYVAHLESLLDSFYTGTPPQHGTTRHHVLAKWGRVRLDTCKRKPSLLQGDE